MHFRGRSSSSTSSFGKRECAELRLELGWEAKRGCEADPQPGQEEGLPGLLQNVSLPRSPRLAVSCTGAVCAGARDTGLATVSTTCFPPSLRFPVCKLGIIAAPFLSADGKTSLWVLMLEAAWPELSLFEQSLGLGEGP